MAVLLSQCRCDYVGILPNPAQHSGYSNSLQSAKILTKLPEAFSRCQFLPGVNPNSNPDTARVIHNAGCDETTMRFTPLLTLPIMLGLSTAALLHTDRLQAEPLLRADADIVYNDNINNGATTDQKKSDTAASIQVNLGQVFALDGDAALSLAGTLAAQKFNHYDGLDNTALGVLASYSRKLGLGRDVPRLSLSASAAHADYRNSVRDGWAYQGNVGISQYLSERWQAHLAYIVYRFDSDSSTTEAANLSGAAFDQIAHSIAVDTTYFYDSRTALMVGYSRRSGDVTATTRPGLGVYRVSSAIEDDDVFGEGFYAYKLRAITHDIYAGLSESVGEHSSINLRYLRRLSYGREDFNYYNSIFSLSWLYAY